MAAAPWAHNNHPGLIGIQGIQALQPWRLKQNRQLLSWRRRSSWQPAEIGMQRLIKSQVEVHRACGCSQGMAHGRLRQAQQAFIRCFMETSSGPLQ